PPMTASPPPPVSTTDQLSLGLRWLDADDSATAHCRGLVHWRDFLAQGERLPAPRRLPLARLWPLLGAINGVLAISGLLVWPDGSGVHLLLFLLAFWATPLLLVLWTALAGLGVGRGPWWQVLITPHRDRVIALWFTRQSLFAQGAFCLAGLAWLWLMLLTRQVIFYWSTSIAAVSATVESLFRGLSLGLLAAPGSASIAAAEAGAITGWQGALLADTWHWAVWLSQVMALWLLIPIAVLLAVCQWQLVRALAHWPRWNQRLRLRYEQCQEPALNYRALQPEQPLAEAPGAPFPTATSLPPEPGFAWQLDTIHLPAGTVGLGSGGYRDDQQAVQEQGGQLRNWYIAASAVPTGDLADLLQLHASAGQPRLFLVRDDRSPTETWQHSWSAFLAANSLNLAVCVVAAVEEAQGELLQGEHLP
ncbi:MAG: DUF2868 domain-containing protein, partial [Bacteroidales bacterium]|nr:DUF2868 domain-containing protein [Bacteroidales bacterium]